MLMYLYLKESLQFQLSIKREKLIKFQGLAVYKRFFEVISFFFHLS
jgi:hypothetical protein